MQLCFLRQFKSSIRKSDYLALRLGFITVGIYFSLTPYFADLAGLLLDGSCYKFYIFSCSYLLSRSTSYHFLIISINIWFEAWKMSSMAFLVLDKSSYKLDFNFEPISYDLFLYNSHCLSLVIIFHREFY